MADSVMRLSFCPYLSENGSEIQEVAVDLSPEMQEYAREYVCRRAVRDPASLQWSDKWHQKLWEIGCSVRSALYPDIARPYPIDSSNRDKTIARLIWQIAQWRMAREVNVSTDDFLLNDSRILDSVKAEEIAPSAFRGIVRS